MTDRPRVYAATRVRHPNGGETRFATPRRLVEWDREKVVPVIADVLRTFGSQREAEAIFDALDREQT